MSKKIDEFLEQYPNIKTRGVYRSCLNKFFQIMETSETQYFKKKRNYEQDINRFFIAISENPPKTVRLYLSTLKLFLSENDVQFPEKFWRSIQRRIKGKRALTMDRIPSNEELKSILTHMDAKGKALFLMLSSSGMRIGEALQTKKADISLDETTPRINISGSYTKTGESRTVFITQEAKEAIKEWLKIREGSLKIAVKRAKRYKQKWEKEIVNDRLFPFDYSTAMFIWNNAITKAGFNTRDNTTKRIQVHIHVLRKYFRTKMGVVIPVDVVEALMGHEVGLTEVYRKFSLEQLADFYKQGESAITVFNDRNGVKKLRDEINVKNEAYDEIINRQASEIDRLKEKLEKYEKSKDRQTLETLINSPELLDALLKKIEGKLTKKHKA